MKNLQKKINCRYAVICRDDMSVVAEMDYFPDCERAIWIRHGRTLNIRALMSDERIVSPPVLRELVYQYIG
ncbi:TPA: hypothetical protein N3A34_001585 [Salmonella enterica subsp. houtenae serovar 43:z4,z23:-]|nr:hypothetical protein [Salmonella enterica subsp. houtenae serovar Houten]